MYPMSSSPIIDAFNQLQAAHNQLTYAASTFHDACTTLHQRVLESRPSLADQNWLEHRLTQLTNELDSLYATEKKLAQSRALICRSMNTSRSSIPINILPTEVWSRIFEQTILPLPCLNTSAKNFRLHPLVVIPSVSSSWRRLATRTPSLWTHIDIFQGHTQPHDSDLYSIGIPKRVLLWFERARNAPVNLHFCAGRIAADSEYIGEMGELVTRAASFTFSPNSSTKCVKKIFRLYNSYGRSESLKTIALAGVVPTVGILINWPTFAPQALTVLNLRDLSIEVAPTLDNLMTLLSRSPNLRTLLLRRVPIAPGHSTSHPEISLPRLRYLEMSYLTPIARESAEYLISSLVPGSGELDARLYMPEHDNYQANDTFQRFLQRSKVTCLYLNHLVPHNLLQLAKNFDCLTELRVLRLNLHEDLVCRNLDALTVTVEDKYTARCPKLRTLCLVSARMRPVAQEQLKRIVDVYDLKWIIIGSRAYFADEFGGQCDENDMLDWLRARVDNVVFDDEIWFDANLDDL